MWILRFHLLQTKDYNKLSRICKKHGFTTRKHSPILYCKALIKHCTHKTSWRSLGREFGIDHILLYKFYDFTRKNNCIEEIFHVFINARIALYIGDMRHIEKDYLDNNRELLTLTKGELRRILYTSP